jgi:hypothetical protein
VTKVIIIKESLILQMFILNSTQRKKAQEKGILYLQFWELFNERSNIMHVAYSEQKIKQHSLVQ